MALLDRRGNPRRQFAPGVALFVTVLGPNFLGDGLHRALDPRGRD